VSNYNNGEDRVDILLKKEENALLFKATNTKEHNTSNNIEKGGIGIVNVQRRLELLYPTKHHLLINDTPAQYEVTLT
ncbi:hypothetical protein ABTM52_20840, partial [Acinetobacter baumannii]